MDTNQGLAYVQWEKDGDWAWDKLMTFDVWEKDERRKKTTNESHPSNNDVFAAKQ